MCTNVHIRARVELPSNHMALVETRLARGCTRRNASDACSPNYPDHASSNSEICVLVNGCSKQTRYWQKNARGQPRLAVAVRLSL
jgi:hypothetical protein